MSRVWARVREEVDKGHQVYVVCPRIAGDESEQGETDQVDIDEDGNLVVTSTTLAAVEQVHRDLLDGELNGLRMQMLHGRLTPDDKERTMRAFAAGDVDVLVATTVIEVGVDVANASLMIVENAERLGLAQLHQLRGRVGRGSTASSCVLLYASPLSALARQRLQTMRETNDGFVIAEKDLELRGPGELLGTRQTGLPTFRIADFARDAGLLPQVRELADRLLAEAPDTADRVIARWVGGAARYASA